MYSFKYGETRRCFSVVFFCQYIKLLALFVINLYTEFRCCVWAFELRLKLLSHYLVVCYNQSSIFRYSYRVSISYRLLYFRMSQDVVFCGLVVGWLNGSWLVGWYLNLIPATSLHCHKITTLSNYYIKGCRTSGKGGVSERNCDSPCKRDSKILDKGSKKNYIFLWRGKDC